MPTIEDCKNCTRTEEVRAEMVDCQDLNQMDVLQARIKEICLECIDTLPFSD